MDVGARQARGVGPGKVHLFNPGVPTNCDTTTGCRAQIYRAVHQGRQNILPQGKGLALLRYDHGGIRGQWMGVDRGNEQPGGLGRRIRHLAIGSRPQGRPHAAADQTLLDLSRIQCARRIRAMGAEINGFGCVINFDYQGLEHASRASIDRYHLAGCGGAVMHTLGFFVCENDLALADDVPFSDRHGGFHTDIIGTDQGDVPTAGEVVDGLRCRRARQWNIDTASNFDHLRFRFSLSSAPRQRARASGRTLIQHNRSIAASSGSPPSLDRIAGSPCTIHPTCRWSPGTLQSPADASVPEVPPNSKVYQRVPVEPSG